MVVILSNKNEMLINKAKESTIIRQKFNEISFAMLFMKMVL